MVRIDLEIGAGSFVQSELFARTFREGMALVEETANYLDGEGRDASKTLERSGAIAYAGASMRLTTQLMQIASWLLVLRAVREGDMKLHEAAEDKYRLKECPEPARGLMGEGLPDRLVNLIENTSKLYERILRLDGELFSAGQTQDDAPLSGAAAQQEALMNAFS